MRASYQKKKDYRESISSSRGKEKNGMKLLLWGFSGDSRGLEEALYGTCLRRGKGSPSVREEDRKRLITYSRGGVGGRADLGNVSSIIRREKENALFLLRE